MHVRDQHPHDGQALQVMLFDLKPSFSRGLVVDAAVHRRPTFLQDTRLARVGQAVTQQPQVDVVQCKGQAHAQPQHARGDFHHAARPGELIVQWVVQGEGGVGVGHSGRGLG